MIRAAVLGKPIAHSLSPLVHGLIYRRLALEYSYERIEADQSQAREIIIASLLSRSVEKPGIDCFSLTMPLKEVGFSLDLPIDDRAVESHSINTVTSKGSFNTDITGLQRVLKEESVIADQVVILGNGATARSALVALDLLPGLSRITVLRRDSTRDQLMPLEREAKIILRPLTDLDVSLLSPETLVVSTVPSSAQSLISSSLAGFEGTLIDFSYAPWPSTFAGVVKGKVISGLPILVAQAVDQARIFTSLEFDEIAMYRETLLSTAQLISAT